MSIIFGLLPLHLAHRRRAKSTAFGGKKQHIKVPRFTSLNGSPRISNPINALRIWKDRLETGERNFNCLKNESSAAFRLGSRKATCHFAHGTVLGAKGVQFNRGKSFNLNNSCYNKSIRNIFVTIVEAIWPEEGRGAENGYPVANLWLIPLHVLLNHMPLSTPNWCRKNGATTNQSGWNESSWHSERLCHNSKCMNW